MSKVAACGRRRKDEREKQELKRASNKSQFYAVDLRVTSEQYAGLPHNADALLLDFLDSLFIPLLFSSPTSGNVQHEKTVPRT